MSNDYPLLESRNIFRTYSIRDKEINILNDVSFKINKGEIIFLVGPSGAGKTSLLYILAGIESPNKGDVMIENKSLYSMNKNRQALVRNEKMGYIFQNFHLLPDLTALENVMLPSMIQCKYSKNLAKDLLDKVGLSKRIDHLPNELSGGEKQRVAIARSMINNPDIIFADEPTGNLDSNSSNEVMNLLMGLVKDQGMSLIIVTHDKKLIQENNRVISIKDGKIQ